MMTDCQYATNFDENIESEVILLDMKDFNLQHLARINVSAFKVFLRFLEEAQPVRIKEIHFLNCPAYMKKFMKISIKTKYYNKVK